MDSHRKEGPCAVKMCRVNIKRQNSREVDMLLRHMCLIVVQHLWKICKQCTRKNLQRKSKRRSSQQAYQFMMTAIVANPNFRTPSFVLIAPFFSGSASGSGVESAGGKTTASITWIMPLLHSTSALVTVAV